MNPARLTRGRVAAAVLSLAAPAFAAACNSTVDAPAEQPVGYLAIDVDASAPGEATPNVIFFKARAPSFANAALASEQCQIGLFDPSASSNSPASTGVDAGSAVQLRLGSTTVQLVPRDSTIGRIYSPANGASVTFSPGDDAALTVPGAHAHEAVYLDWPLAALTVPGAQNGFPAATLTLKTAEPVQFNPVSAASTGSDLDVTWAGTSSQATMVISLRYLPGGQSSYNQVLCFASDDGAFTIPGQLLANWRAATTTNRSAVATRFRTALTQTGDAYLYGISSYATSVEVTRP